MPRTSYVYEIRNEITGSKINGGSIRAESMEQAASYVASMHKLSVEITGEKGDPYPRHRLIRPDGKYVHLWIFTHAHRLDALPVIDKRN